MNLMKYVYNCTVIKTTDTNEEKVFYSMSLGLGHVTLMTVR